MFFSVHSTSVALFNDIKIPSVKEYIHAALILPTVSSMDGLSALFTTDALGMALALLCIAYGLRYIHFPPSQFVDTPSAFELLPSVSFPLCSAICCYFLPFSVAVINLADLPYLK